MEYVHEVLSGARHFALENSTAEYLSFNPCSGAVRLLVMFAISIQSKPANYRTTTASQAPLALAFLRSTAC